MTALASLALDELMTSSITNVFATMLSLEVKPAFAPPGAEMPVTETVAGSVGFAGGACGVVYFRLPDDCARNVAGTMLGMPGAELGETEVNDVIAELTNMLAGDLKTRLGSAGFNCALSVPTVVRGRGLHIAALDRFGGSHEERHYECPAGSTSLVVAIKANQ